MHNIRFIERYFVPDHQEAVTNLYTGNRSTDESQHITLLEGLNGVNRQPNGPKINRQPSKTEYFYHQPSNERAKISRQISQISLNDRDQLT